MGDLFVRFGRFVPSDHDGVEVLHPLSVQVASDGLCRYRPLLLQDAQPVGYIAQLTYIAGPAVTH